MDRSRTHIGDLAAIIRAVRGSKEPELATPSPASLLSQLSGVGGQEKGEEELLVGKPQLQTRRRLVEEIPKRGREKETGFAANLRKAFGPGRKDNENEEEVKIRHNETFLTEVQTRRIK